MPAHRALYVKARMPFRPSAHLWLWLEFALEYAKAFHERQEAYMRLLHGFCRDARLISQKGI